MIDVVLLVLACICLGAAAIGVKASVNLVALGLLFYAIRGLLP